MKPLKFSRPYSRVVSRKSIILEPKLRMPGIDDFFALDLPYRYTKIFAIFTNVSNLSEGHLSRVRPFSFAKYNSINLILKYTSFCSSYKYFPLYIWNTVRYKLLLVGSNKAGAQSLPLLQGYLY